MDLLDALAAFLTYMYREEEPVIGLLVTIGFLTSLLLGRRIRLRRSAR